MADVSRDPYRVLGVSPTATDAEITGAYRRLVRHLHPDAGGDPDPRELEQVMAAYHLLRDPGRRAAHDRERDQNRGQPRSRPEAPSHPIAHDEQVTDIPVRHHADRPPDLRAGPVRRHR
ncbi:J domain-containing protein [Haloechinothrix salitolerans]|uniref:J domain-containing protein n=1 Tax=Haloechinothrix salitolerans TaxID=926830 RepID=A0ABW2CAJ6_9PSEU